MALLPSSTTPVSIQSVNQVSNTYYIPNHAITSPTPIPNPNLPTGMNGFTKLLNTATLDVTSGGLAVCCYWGALWHSGP